MTDLANLPDIIAAGGILSRIEVENRGTNLVDAAHSNIVEQRRVIAVPTGGCLLDYVPFYFNPLSPMLYAKKSRKVDGYNGSQESIAHIVVEVDDAIALDGLWACTNRHAILAHAEFISDADRIKEHVDWDAIRVKYWNDPNDPDLKSRRQAEFLIRDKVPMEIFKGIGVMNDTAKGKVEQHFANAAPIIIKTISTWYF